MCLWSWRKLALYSVYQVCVCVCGDWKGTVKGVEGDFVGDVFFFFPSGPLWLKSCSSEQINLPLDCLPVLSIKRFLIYFCISNSKGIVSIWIHLTCSFSFFHL